MKKRDKHTSSGLSRRIHFPEESSLPWLPMLLDAYAIADTGVAVAIRNAEKRLHKKLACGKGCGTCCVHQTDLPLYPHEIIGIYWYASEKLSGPLRDRLKARLMSAPAGRGCPFLIDDACVIHPLRPIGCRQFNVLSAPCATGEDPYFTRRHDVVNTDPEYVDRAFGAVLKLYDMTSDRDTAGAIRAIRSQIMNLLSMDWTKLAVLLETGGTSGTAEAKQG